MPVSLILYAAAAIAVLFLGRIAWQWLVFREIRLITCPENQRPAGVRLDAWHAAVTGIGKPDFRLSSCTRWPEMAGCDQQCLRQIEAAPVDCEARRILANWYHGKRCAFCGLPFGEVVWEVRKPALLHADMGIVDWTQIAFDQLPEVLQQSRPVCFACHTATTLVREHPDLVVTRSGMGLAGGETTGKI